MDTNLAPEARSEFQDYLPSYARAITADQKQSMKLWQRSFCLLWAKYFEQSMQL